MLSACSETGNRIDNADSVSEMVTNDTAVVYDKNRPWNADSYDREPVINEPGLRNYDVEMRGSDARNVYAMEQDILFDTDQAKLRAAADEKLAKVSESIRNRMKDGTVRIQVYGYTDSRAGKAYNKDLGRDRAQAVAAWLTKNGKFDESKITIESKGQTEPVATNETAAGRQDNRRVEIVVIQS
ncbi:Outer membrane protein OmpA [Hymenobacter psychrophilus]|uniref:Outer membrane protein OmpA n=2 Tax=Hymenobacter psychrophilus TaxID=651662 RepID=A0A1H3MYG9_9BACT|nr:Outer membrane protein OmpA [Hymenobacter psychrophilus]